MYSLKYCFLVLFASLQFQPSEEVAAAVITAAKTAIGVIDFAMSVDEFVGNQQSDEPEDISNEELLTKIDDLIGSATTDIITSVLEISKLGKIEDTVRAVHSSLWDLRKIIEARDPAVAKAYQDDFVRHYSEHGVVMHVRFLTEILSFKIPGQQYELLFHMTEKTRCNLTAFAEFAEFFVGFVSDGIALQLVYNRLTNSVITPQQVIEDEWSHGLQKIQADLNKAEQHCVGQFSELAWADLQSSTSATALGQNNAQRYIYNWTDAMFYAHMGTDQFHYRKHAADHLLYQSTGDQIKVAVFGSREQNKIWDAPTVAKNLSETGFAVPGKDDQKAARKVGEAVEAHVRKLGYSITAIVVYLEGSDFSEKGTFKDEDSPVAAFELPGVELVYWQDRPTWLGGGRESTSGKFKIFVYPHTETNLTYTTGRASAPQCSVTAIIALVTMLMCAL